MAKKAQRHPGRPAFIKALCVFSLLLFGGVGWVRIAGRAPVMAAPPASDVTAGAPASVAPAAGPAANSLLDEQTLVHAGKGARVGHVRVLGGDMISLEGDQLRLWKVREAAGYSHCGYNPNQWPCGTTSATALAGFVADHLVACYDRGRNARGEATGQCFLGTLDVGGWLVEQGMAFPDGATPTHMYDVKQSLARTRRAGIWHDG